jgi:ferric-dicitrate binding protein FerR (iron transport regulator)
VGQALYDSAAGWIKGNAQYGDGWLGLEAGSELVVREDGSERVEPLDVARVTSWRAEKLVFEGERLADVLTEMNRYSREQLVGGDPALNERKISGVFEPTSGFAFARALEIYGIAPMSQINATTVLLSSA